MSGLAASRMTRRRWFALVGGALLAVIGGASLLVYAGIYNVAADIPHTQPVFWLMTTVRERSIAVRAAGAVVPGLTPFSASKETFENDIRRERQMDGIRKARERGIRFGRKPLLVSETIQQVKKLRQAVEIIRQTSLSKASVYRALTV